jgi:hypothetical protein
MIASDHHRQYSAGHSSMLIPGCSFQQSMMIREGRKPELAAFGNEVTVQVLRQNLSVRLHSFMGAGFAVTANRRRLGSSQTSIGSTKGPVEKSQ